MQTAPTQLADITVLVGKDFLDMVAGAQVNCTFIKFEKKAVIIVVRDLLNSNG